MLTLTRSRFSSSTSLLLSLWQQCLATLQKRSHIGRAKPLAVCSTIPLVRSWFLFRFRQSQELTFKSNAVELIVSIIALIQGQTLIVQTSLIGSMLSNLLLVMGMCFFFGGFNRVEQAFNITVAQTAASLLFLAVSSLILPTAFHAFSGAGDVGIKQISRATSVLLLLVYACYIFFQLKTHAEMYNTPSEKNEKKEMKGAKRAGRMMKDIAKGDFRRKSALDDGTVPESPPESREGKKSEKEEEEPEPQLSLLVAILTLAGSTVLV